MNKSSGIDDADNILILSIQILKYNFAFSRRS